MPKKNCEKEVRLTREKQELIETSETSKLKFLYVYFLKQQYRWVLTLGLANAAQSLKSIPREWTLPVPYYPRLNVKIPKRFQQRSEKILHALATLSV